MSFSLLLAHSQPLRRLLFASVLVFLLWFTFAFDGIATAAAIWYGNEIFNHGLLILPAVIYFIYIKRGKWLSEPITTTKLALPFLAAGILLYVVGFAGDIGVLKHIAAFGLLPVLVWLLIGHRATYQLIFPLFFIVFAIPVGEQLVPWLQEVTADISVFLLQLSGIPLFRTGLYIEIPQGRFLVAEACSGISFFISSIVVGCVYSYLNFNSTKKKIAFVVLSIVYPIIANALRVYGIILTGYLTDMEHAVGADHLIYGWFFFAIVLISLLAIGEFFRDTNVVWEVPLKNNREINVAVSKWTLAFAALLILTGIVWLQLISQSISNVQSKTPQFWESPTGFLSKDEKVFSEYRPKLSHPTAINFTAKEAQNGKYNVVFQAWFDGANDELVTGLHRLFEQQEWSLVKQFKLSSSPIDDLQVNLITNPMGNKRLVASWYLIADKQFGTATNAKLYQTGLVLLGGGADGKKMIVSVPLEQGQSAELGEKALLHLIDEFLSINRY